MALAARYRPQTFAEVAGQDMVKAVLSRAALEDRPACAYLFSGTRGVGKTTLARIFAKTLNCQNAPAAEPCNACPQCEKITRGIHVDVAEIDGASNNGVEDARALRENIGYAPMEGRYKIFIIDEAHMLSRSAFNALLKTLEEPPPRVCFIFATTEAHRFPSTIISRCQHFILRHLDDQAIIGHLGEVLAKEGVDSEPDVLRLIAMRAGGSVRDAMSLLEQTLALGGERLTADSCRQILGLAGIELQRALLQAVLRGDCAEIVTLARQIFVQGVDIGFFMREITASLRNFFLLRKAGKTILPALNLGQEEEAMCALSQGFSPAHLHACWQMALEAQRNIARSPEPAAALELLLLNMAFLPELLPVEKLSTGPLPGPETDGCGPGEKKTESAEPRPAPLTPADSPRLQPQEGRGSGMASIAGSPQDSAPDPVSIEDSALLHKRDQHAPESSGSRTHDWESFVRFYASRPQSAISPIHLQHGMEVEWQPGQVLMRLRSAPAAARVRAHLQELEKALAEYCDGATMRVILLDPPPRRSEQELIEEFSRDPELGPCLKILGATITHCTPLGDQGLSRQARS